MSLSATDLISPNGKLQEALFPDGDLLENAVRWLATAYTKIGGVDSVNHDAAAENYAYYLAYSHVADRLASDPNSVTVDDVTKQTGADRIAYFARLAQKHLDTYEGLFPGPANPERPRSTWVRNQIIF